MLIIINNIELVKLYCQIDEFCKRFIPNWEKRLIEDHNSKKAKKKIRKSYKNSLSYDEIMTILILYNSSSYKL